VVLDGVFIQGDDKVDIAGVGLDHAAAGPYEAEVVAASYEGWVVIPEEDVIAKFPEEAGNKTADLANAVSRLAAYED
jgi:predicted ATP-dependent endonuclease of OLD family